MNGCEFAVLKSVFTAVYIPVTVPVWFAVGVDVASSGKVWVRILIFVLDFSFTLALYRWGFAERQCCDGRRALLGAASAFGTCVER